MQKLLPLLTFCFFMLTGYQLCAQNILGKPILDYSSKAPEVQQMQKFVDVPVSYFNGTPNISIPVRTGNISTRFNVPLPYYSLGLSDSEPDLFYFDFGGYSDKFIFDAYRNPILIPH